MENIKENINLWIGDQGMEDIGVPSNEELAIDIFHDFGPDMRERVREHNSLSEVSQSYLDNVVGNKDKLLSKIERALSITKDKMSKDDGDFKESIVETIVSTSLDDFLVHFSIDWKLINYYSEELYNEVPRKIYRVNGSIGDIRKAIITTQNIRKLFSVARYKSFFEGIKKEVAKKGNILVGYNLNHNETLEGLKKLGEVVDLKSSPKTTIYLKENLYNKKAFKWVEENNIEVRKIVGELHIGKVLLGKTREEVVETLEKTKKSDREKGPENLTLDLGGVKVDKEEELKLPLTVEKPLEVKEDSLEEKDIYHEKIDELKEKQIKEIKWVTSVEEIKEEPVEEEIQVLSETSIEEKQVEREEETPIEKDENTESLNEESVTKEVEEKIQEDSNIEEKEDKEDEKSSDKTIERGIIEAIKPMEEPNLEREEEPKSFLDGLGEKIVEEIFEGTTRGRVKKLEDIEIKTIIDLEFENVERIEHPIQYVKKRVVEDKQGLITEVVNIENGNVTIYNVNIIYKKGTGRRIITLKTREMKLVFEGIVYDKKTFKNLSLVSYKLSSNLNYKRAIATCLFIHKVLIGCELVIKGKKQDGKMEISKTERSKGLLRILDVLHKYKLVCNDVGLSLTESFPNVLKRSKKVAELFFVKEDTPIETYVDLNEDLYNYLKENNTNKVEVDGSISIKKHKVNYKKEVTIKGELPENYRDLETPRDKWKEAIVRYRKVL